MKKKSHVRKIIIRNHVESTSKENAIKVRVRYNFPRFFFCLLVSFQLSSVASERKKGPFRDGNIILILRKELNVEVVSVVRLSSIVSPTQTNSISIHGR